MSDARRRSTRPAVDLAARADAGQLLGHRLGVKGRAELLQRVALINGHAHLIYMGGPCALRFAVRQRAQ